MAGDLNPEQLEKEFLPFLSLDSRPDVRSLAIQYFLGLTGSAQGCSFLATKDSYLAAICEVTRDSDSTIARHAFKALVNLSADEKISKKLTTLPSFPSIVEFLLLYILNQDSPHADFACKTLSNLTRLEASARTVFDIICQKQDVIGLEKYVHALCLSGFNKHKQTLDYLALVLCNLTQVPVARLFILDKDYSVIQRLLPFTTYENSMIRRGGVVGVLRNCCFETEFHQWLLSDDVDLLPHLLLPLAGPEEFDDDEMDKLPPDLQYLPPEKRRESDPDIRIMICEALVQLCATRLGREFLRDKNAYVILRELHKWEKDPGALAAVENVVQVLIREEHELGAENLKEVDIPSDVVKRLQEGFEQTQQEIQKETNEMYRKEEETTGNL